MKPTSKHDIGVSDLAHRLFKKNYYKSVDMFVPYFKSGITGEVDVLAYHLSSGTYHFYEYKSRLSDAQVRKAKEQYKNFCKAHPKLKVKGILVSKGRARRLYSPKRNDDARYYVVEYRGFTEEYVMIRNGESFSLEPEEKDLEIIIRRISREEYIKKGRELQGNLQNL